MTRKFILLILLPLLGTACSSASKSSGLGANAAKSEKAAVEISYVQGDNFRHLVILDAGGSVVARNYLNKKLLTEAKVDREKFRELLQKASALVNEIAARAVNNPESHAPQQETLEGLEDNAPCHSPFTVIVRTGKTTQTASGCKSTAEGTSFSRFTRDAEFFLYSKK